jgi:hypothetical protein
MIKKLLITVTELVAPLHTTSRQKTARFCVRRNDAHRDVMWTVQRVVFATMRIKSSQRALPLTVNTLCGPYVGWKRITKSGVARELQNNALRHRRSSLPNQFHPRVVTLCGHYAQTRLMCRKNLRPVVIRPRWSPLFARHTTYGACIKNKHTRVAVLVAVGEIDAFDTSMKAPLDICGRSLMVTTRRWTCKWILLCRGPPACAAGAKCPITLQL